MTKVRTARLMRWVLLILITAAPSGLVCFAQTVAAPARPTRNFTIGYLREGSDIANAPGRMAELRTLLRGRYSGALAAYGDVVLSPCDGPRDMIQRAIGGEFDLVFATAMVYAQLGAAPYEPILQLYQPPGDYLPPPPQDSGALRQGVIFVGPRSPLFNQKSEPTREELRKLLEEAPLAVASADSAVGYLSPRYIMMHDLGIKTVPAPLFCDSDAEVIKHVVAGLAQVGSCRSGALEELFPGGRATAYVRVLRKTYPLPTDPILLRRELLPSRSDVGVALKRALREDFLKNRVANASPRNFEVITRYLQELQEGRPAATDGAPAATAAATTETAPALPTPAVMSPALPTPVATAPPAETPAAATTPAPRPALPTAPPLAATPQPRPALPPMVKPLPGAAEALPAPTPVREATPAPRPALPGAALAPPPSAATPAAARPPARPDERPALPKPPASESAAPMDKPTPALSPAGTPPPPARPTPRPRPALPRAASNPARRATA